MIRVMFESNQNNEINEADVFKFIATTYLKDYSASYAGFININAKYLKENKFEPVWQYVMDKPIDLDRLVDYVSSYKCPGYHIKVSKQDPGHKEIYLYY